jgi:hypothetical protein
MMIEFLPFRLGLDMIGVVKNNPALLDRINVLLVGMLIKREQDIGFVPGTEHFAGTNPHLKNGWAPGDG